MKTVVLPAWHYAAGWPAESAESVRPLGEVTELGCQYAATQSSDLLLEICRCFHPYLMKYLTMICRGHLPVRRGGEGAAINRDVEPFIRYFLPKGTPVNRASMALGQYTTSIWPSRTWMLQRSTTS